MSALLFINIMHCCSPLESVYRTLNQTLIESVLSFNIVTWYGNLMVENRTKLSQIANASSKLIGTIKQHQLFDLYQLSVKFSALSVYVSLNLSL